MKARQVHLRRIFRLVNGGTPASDSEHWGGAIVWITPQDLSRVDGGVIQASERTIGPSAIATSSATVSPPGSIVVSTRAPVGYVAELAVPAATNQGCKTLVAKRPVVPRFFRYVLQANRSAMEAAAQGSTFRELGYEGLATLLVPCVPLATQRQIADYLNRETARIDALIAAKAQTENLLIQRWQALMAAGAAGRLTSQVRRRPSSIPWLTDIPSEWREGKLNLVASVGSGHTPSRQHPEWWEGTTIPWITTGDVAQMRSDRSEYIIETRESISELGLANSSAVLHPAGTVVLCRTASAGYSAIMGLEMATSQDFATWTCGPLIRPRFLLLCLRVMRQDLLGRLAMGSTHQTIYMPDIESIKVPLPPLDEQDEIVESVYSQLPSINAALTALGQQTDRLKERRQALITAAITGELEIPGAVA